MPSPARKAINNLIPKFAKNFKQGNILFVGVDRVYDYAHVFKGCNYQTLDINPETRPDIVADIQDSKLPANSFDGIIMVGVYEYLPKPRRAFEEIARILKPTGKALICVPSVGYYPEPRKVVTLPEIASKIYPLKMDWGEITLYRGIPNYLNIIATK